MPIPNKPRPGGKLDEINRPGRPTFGFIVNWGLTNPYARPMWWGAVEAAEDAGCKSGRFRRYQHLCSPAQPLAVSMIQPGRLDGLILVNPTFTQLPQDVFSSVPIVNIGCPGRISSPRSWSITTTACVRP